MRKPSLCALCGGSLSREDSSKEHVFPSSWYPNTTPDKVQRWTIRTHQACNRIYGDESTELRTLFATALGPGKTASSGLWESVFRSVDPDSTRDTQEKEYRQRARERLTEAVSQLDEVPHEGIIPGIGEQEVVISVNGKVPVIYVPAKLLTTVAEKIIRCVLYKLENRVLDKGELTLYAALPTRKAEESLKHLIEAGASITRYAIPPAFSVVHAAGKLALNESMTILIVSMWGEWTIAGIIANREQLDKLGQAIRRNFET